MNCIWGRWSHSATFIFTPPGIYSRPACLKWPNFEQTRDRCCALNVRALTADKDLRKLYCFAQNRCPLLLTALCGSIIDAQKEHAGLSAAKPRATGALSEVGANQIVRAFVAARIDFERGRVNQVAIRIKSAE